MSGLVAWSTWPRNYELSAISGNGAIWQDVRSPFHVSPDGRYAVFLADMALNDKVEVFSVRLDGESAPVRLSAAGHAYSYSALYGARIAITPDGTRVCYRTTSDASFFVVPIDGSSGPVEVPGFLAPDPVFTDGGERFVYYGYGALWSGRIDGAEPLVQLATYVIPFNTLPEWGAQLNGDRAVFTRGSSPSDLELCSVPVDGSSPAVVLDHGLRSTSIGARPWSSPDGSRVAYLVDGNLYSIPVDGSGERVQLNPTLVAGGACTLARFTPDGTRIVYQADQDTDEVFDLYSVPAGGGSVVKLDGADAPVHWEIARDGQRVVFQTYDGATMQLFSVLVDGSAAPTELQGPIGFWPYGFQISPQSDHVAFSADVESDGTRGLYTVPIDGSAAPLLLAAAPLPPRSILELRYAPDGTSLVYAVSGSTGGVVTEPIELFAVLADGSADPVTISGPLVGGGSVRYDHGISFRFDASGLRVAYLADQQRDEAVELYGSRLPHQRRVRPR